jgi:hypothetical protein
VVRRLDLPLVKQRKPGLQTEEYVWIGHDYGGRLMAAWIDK